MREIETYYPRLHVQPVNPRALKVKPYFPSYLFIRTDLQTIGISTLQWLPGAIGLVDFGGELATISEDLLQVIRSKVERMNAASGELWEGLKAGDVVAIQEGPFAGYQAIFDARVSGKERVRVLLQLLRDRKLGVELSIRQIERIQ